MTARDSTTSPGQRPIRRTQRCDLRHISLGPGGRSRSITDSHGRLRTQPVAAGLPPAFAFDGSGVHRGCGAEQSCRRCRAERPVALADPDHHHRSGAEPGNCASPAGHVPPPACAIGRVWTLYRFLRMQDKQEPIHTDQQSGPLPAPVHDKDSARNPPFPGSTGRRITMDERLCRSVRRGEPDDQCCAVVMLGADEVRSRRERDKLTITDVCARSRHQPPDALRMAGEGPGAQCASRFRAAACVSAAPNISAGCLPVYLSSHDHRYTRSNLDAFLRQGGLISFRNRRRLSCRKVLGMKRSHLTPRAGRSGLSSS